MKTISSSSFSVLLALCGLLLVGCATATNTTVKLTGTPGTQVKGHYRATHLTSDFSGTAAWQMDLGRQQLHEFEFRKLTPADSVDLEIRRGRTTLVHATAEPGTVGLRARDEGGWKVEPVN